MRNFRQHYRGRMWHVLADPASNQFFRLDEPAFQFVGLLDGRRTVSEAWRIVSEDMGDAAPTQGEAIQLLGQLYTSNLLQAEMPPDAEQMFTRYRKRIRREVSSFLMNFLFVRLPLFDPQPLLRATTPLVGWIFGPVGFVLWLAMLAVGFSYAVERWDELLRAADPQTMLKTENLVYLGLCFVVIKAIHEMGHAYACAHFGRKGGTGGPVHTIGLMFMVFMPVPYVDASSSWTFRNKWHRAFVAAAGMYVELAVAAVAAVVWAMTDKTSVVHDLAYNALFIASVSTLLFNANPLLRFDGYYILSDVLEIANLAQRSKQYLQYLGKRYIFGVRRARSTAHSPGERFWLATYGVASFVYRIFVAVAILLYIADFLPLFGAIMAIAAVVTWVIVPTGKFIKYLALDAELERVRSRAVTASAVTAAAVVGFVGLVPWPDRGRAEGVVEPDAPARFAVVYMPAEGFIQSALPSGTRVSPDGPPLFTATNRQLASELLQTEAQLVATRLERELARPKDAATVPVFTERITAYNDTLERKRQDLDSLTVRAPFDGVWVSRDAERLSGVFLDRGQQVGLVADPSELVARVTADQTLGPRIETGVTKVELRVRGRPDILVKGTIEEVLPAGQKELPSAALGYVAGGSVRVSMEDQSGTTAAEPFFEVRIRLDEQASRQLMIGQRVVARFDMGPQPLAFQWLRSIRQLIQRRFS